MSDRLHEWLERNGTPGSWRTAGGGPDPVARVEREVYEDFGAVYWSTELVNEAGTDSAPVRDWLSLDATVLETFDPCDLVLTTGALSTARDFTARTVRLHESETFAFSPGGGRSSSEHLPFFELRAGEQAVLVAVGWSGEWEVGVVRDEPGRVRVRIGLRSTDFFLRPGESVTGPSVLLIFGTGSAVDARNTFRRLVRRHFSPPGAATSTGPGVALATWGGTPTDVHLQVVAQLAERQVPYDLYWVDAGWYGASDEWWSNVGSWEPGADRHPDGLTAVSDAVHAAGKKLVLWFEPERVTRGSTLEREHPEWLLRLPPQLRTLPNHDRSRADFPVVESRHNDFGGDDSLFDLGIPAARQHLADHLSGLIEAWGVDVYRQDFNVAPLDFWRHNDEPSRTGLREAAYVAGLYWLWDELRRRHPALVIDNCASGGRRLDLECVRRTYTLTRSDYVADPVGHQVHHLGIARWLPLHGTITHAGFSRYALLSGAGPGMALSWATRFNLPEDGPFPDDFDFAGLDRTLREVAGLAPYYAGDFHPLTENDPDEPWCAYQYHLPGSGAGVVVGFRRTAAAPVELEVRLAGGPGTHRTSDGTALSGGRLLLRADEAGQAVVVHYRTEP